MADRRGAAPESAELRRLRRRIDILDRRIVALLNERARVAREAGRAKAEAGRSAIRDADREREILLRVSMANEGPMPQADLLALYRRLFAATRALEARDRQPGSSATGAVAGPTTDVAVGSASLTRFAPAPTGFLHLGHVANAAWTWKLAGSAGARVLLRIEDHDRQRCRPEYDAALLEDLDWLGFRADFGPVRQTDADAQAAYADAYRRLASEGSTYGCDCTRATFRAWAAAHGRPWAGIGCPGGCRERHLDGPVVRAALGAGGESWMDALVGPCRDEVASSGDLPIRDRHGNWTYAFCVVVDDARQGVDLVVRGMDLLHATAAQIRLAAAARPRDAAPVRAPPAGAAARRQQAVQVRGRHRGARAAGRWSPPGRGRRAGRPVDRPRGVGRPLRLVPRGPPSPRHGRGHATRCGGLRSAGSTSGRRADRRRTACAGRPAPPRAPRRPRRGPRDVARAA